MADKFAFRKCPVRLLRSLSCRYHTRATKVPANGGRDVVDNFLEGNVGQGARLRNGRDLRNRQGNGSAWAWMAGARDKTHPRFVGERRIVNFSLRNGRHIGGIVTYVGSGEMSR